RACGRVRKTPWFRVGRACYHRTFRSRRSSSVRCRLALMSRATAAMTSPRRELRRRQLLDAARDVFAEKGYVAATVDDVVARCGVARGTFYLYFDDKLDVFGALVSDFFA